jgi:hypothetical protein
LLIASREDKNSLQKQLQAKEEEILSLKAKDEELLSALQGEQAKVQALATEMKNLKSLNAHNNNEIVELKLKLKYSEVVNVKQAANVERVEAALKAEQEKVANLQKQLQAKEEELLSALQAEQAKVEALVIEKKNLKSLNAQNNSDIVELKLKLKDSETVNVKQAADVERVEAALKSEQEKVADLQIQSNIKTQGKVTGGATELVATTVVPEAGKAAGKAEQEGRRRSILNFFI